MLETFWGDQTAGCKFSSYAGSLWDFFWSWSKGFHWQTGVPGACWENSSWLLLYLIQMNGTRGIQLNFQGLVSLPLTVMTSFAAFLDLHHAGLHRYCCCCCRNQQAPPRHYPHYLLRCHQLTVHRHHLIYKFRYFNKIRVGYKRIIPQNDFC